MCVIQRVFGSSQGSLTPTLALLSTPSYVLHVRDSNAIARIQSYTLQMAEHAATGGMAPLAEQGTLGHACWLGVHKPEKITINLFGAHTVHILE